MIAGREKRSAIEATGLEIRRTVTPAGCLRDGIASVALGFLS